MSAKGKNWFDFRTILIILIVLLIITGAYVLITSEPGETENILSVKEVKANKDKYIKSGEEITVKGYYHYHSDNRSEITDTADIVPGVSGLVVDHSNVENLTSLDEGTPYLFTGILTEGPTYEILIASKIDRK